MNESLIDWENKHIDIPFEVKKEDIGDDGSFLGYGSLFVKKPDSYGDIVAPGAFTKSLRKKGRNGNGIAMLWQHKADQIPGVWKELSEDQKGLKSIGQLAITTPLGFSTHEIMKLGAELKTFQLNESIGYDTVECEVDDKKKCRTLKEVELWEVSLVTFPARTGASVITVKSIQEATTPRQLEDVLRESGLSKSAAQYVVGLCKHSPLLREADVEGAKEVCAGMLSDILGGLKQVNEEIIISLEEKSVIPFKSYPLAGINTAWDGGAEKKKATVDDLKKMCAWYDSSRANVKGAYKLPHHKASGYSTVWRGVANAMARLLQPRTQIPATERRGVYRHLSRHYKEFDKETPPFKDYTQMEWESQFPEDVKTISLSEILDSLEDLNLN